MIEKVENIKLLLGSIKPMFRLRFFLTVGGADKGEAGEDPQEGHGSIMSALTETDAFIWTGSDVIGQKRDQTEDILSETLGVWTGGADGEFST